MGRIHLFELEDQPWFPARVRDVGTAYLRFAVTLSGQADSILPKLREALETSGSRRIVDLCSGGAGPLAYMVNKLREQGVDVTARLTDLFPNREAFDQVARDGDGAIEFEEKPVDATRVPPGLTGLRTLFNAFHHFRPDQARRILTDAVAARQPIAIFELVGREPFPFVAILFAPLAVMLAVPFLKPFRWTNLLFTWLIPLVPLLVLWDGLVSMLRIYSVPELETLVASIDAPGAADYAWDIGRIRQGAAPAHATYLVGVPGRATEGV